MVTRATNELQNCPDTARNHGQLSRLGHPSRPSQAIDSLSLDCHNQTRGLLLHSPH